MLQVIQFLKDHPEDGLDRLKQEPYALQIKVDGHRVHLKYNQLSSDFSLPIVQECRGLILEQGSWRILACPFFKFFNYGEPHAHVLDWTSISVTKKEDGSLIKVWFDDVENRWIVSSNGGIFADCSGLHEQIEGAPYTTLGEVFSEGLRQLKVDLTLFPKGYTHVFEVMSPYNQVVVTQKTIEVKHLMSRKNSNLQEVVLDLGVPKPEKYQFTTIEALQSWVNQLTSQDEGVVLCDKNGKRLKIKSPDYVKMHYLKNLKDASSQRLFEIIYTGELEEARQYLTTFTTRLTKIESLYQDYLSHLAEFAEEVNCFRHLSRPEFAAKYKKHPQSGYAFAYYQNSNLTISEYLATQNIKSIWLRIEAYGENQDVAKKY